jgi:hypothetical protein
MKETLELRVDEEAAGRVFAADEGERMGHVRKVMLAPGDPRLPVIENLQDELRGEGGRFFGWWYHHRRYTPTELRNASALVLMIGWTSALDGEVAGTVYDTASQCPLCGAGRRKLSPLRLHFGKLPRVNDIIRAGSGEFVVSQHFVDAYHSAGGTGAAFTPVEFRRLLRKGTPTWYEMTSTAEPVSMRGGTLFASSPFPDTARDQHYECPLGDTVGLRRISELHLVGSDALDADVVETRESVGSQPHRELLLSGRLRQRLLDARVRGLKFEIARPPLD